MKETSAWSQYCERGKMPFWYFHMCKSLEIIDIDIHTTAELGEIMLPYQDMSQQQRK